MNESGVMILSRRGGVPLMYLPPIVKMLTLGIILYTLRTYWCIVCKSLCAIKHSDDTFGSSAHLALVISSSRTVHATC